MHSLAWRSRPRPRARWQELEGTEPENRNSGPSTCRVPGWATGVSSAADGQSQPPADSELAASLRTGEASIPRADFPCATKNEYMQGSTLQLFPIARSVTRGPLASQELDPLPAQGHPTAGRPGSRPRVHIRNQINPNLNSLRPGARTHQCPG